MSISSPVTVTIGGSGGSAKDLVRITQDNYGSTYLLRESTQEFELIIRHSREKVVVGKLPIERHNVQLTQTVYGSDGDPDVVRQIFFVLRNNKADVAADVVDLGEALAYFMSATHLADLLGWAN